MCTDAYTQYECAASFSPGLYTIPHEGRIPSDRCEKKFRRHFAIISCGSKYTGKKVVEVDHTKKELNVHSGVDCVVMGIGFCPSCKEHNRKRMGSGGVKGKDVLGSEESGNGKGPTTGKEEKRRKDEDGQRAGYRGGAVREQEQHQEQERLRRREWASCVGIGMDGDRGT
jgi:hypothetical protein